jgi:hypothetical protein
MPVFDTNDLPINPDRFADKFIGAMCEITFTLKHYTIRRHTKPDGNVVEPNNVFSAQVEGIAILKNPPIIVRSPYKGKLTRRPHHKPQVPTGGEQINTTVFVPQPCFASSILAGQSTAPSLTDPGLISQSSTAVASLTDRSFDIDTSSTVTTGPAITSTIPTVDPISQNTATTKPIISNIKPQGSPAALDVAKY